MCIGVPCKVIDIDGKEVIVEFSGNKFSVKNALKLKKGDYVLVQRRIAVKKISEKEAKEILRIFESLRSSRESSP